MANSADPLFAMPSGIAIPSYVLVTITLLWATYRLLQVGRRPKGLPPGPPTLPILGNIHQMPTKNPHLQFQAWAQEYGAIYSLMLGTTTMIVLNDDKAVKELLDRRSSNYSSRPDLYFGQTLLSGGNRMGMMPYGSAWRTIRKVFHNALHVNKSAEYVSYQELENKQMLYDIMHEPDELMEHLRRYASSLTTSIVYGFRWPSFSDATMQALYHNLDNYVRLNLTGGAALADFYPILRYVPYFLSSGKREAYQHHNHEIKLYTNLWLKAKSAILNKEKDRRVCVCDEVIKMQQEENVSDLYAAYIGAQLWEAGSDTTSTELYGFYQALLLYPEVQAKGQEELDRVIGNDRMPTLDDMDQLPYVRACVKESLRWLPTAVLGAFPHATTEEDTYEGYKIPKNASVVLNVWTIHRDPARYYTPERFVPERFFGDSKTSQESSASMDVSKRDHFGFGSGRRICPGMSVADRSMLLGIARTFWAFDVKPKLDATGEPKLPVQDDFLPGFVAIPRYFDVNITPRSEQKAEIVRREWRNAQKDLGQDGQFLQK